jgi:hypothetical protein
VRTDLHAVRLSSFKSHLIIADINDLDVRFRAQCGASKDEAVLVAFDLRVLYPNFV